MWAQIPNHQFRGRKAYTKLNFYFHCRLYFFSFFFFPVHSYIQTL